MDDRSEFQRRIGVGERQVAFGRLAGTDDHRQVPHELTGRNAGEQIRHWDGRESAIVRPETTYLTGSP